MDVLGPLFVIALVLVEVWLVWRFGAVRLVERLTSVLRWVHEALVAGVRRVLYGPVRPSPALPAGYVPPVASLTPERRCEHPGRVPVTVEYEPGVETTVAWLCTACREEVAPPRPSPPPGRGSPSPVAVHDEEISAGVITTGEIMAWGAAEPVRTVVVEEQSRCTHRGRGVCTDPHCPAAEEHAHWVPML